METTIDIARVSRARKKNFIQGTIVILYLMKNKKDI